jgi:hypothetical protein
MPDYIPAALAAAEAAIYDELRSSREVEPDALARAALEAAAPLLSETLRIEIVNLHGHLDADHAVMVQLGHLAETAVQMLEHVRMDTDEDRELHARAVGALRDRLGEIAAAVKEANEAAR